MVTHSLVARRALVLGYWTCGAFVNPRGDPSREREFDASRFGGGCDRVDASRLPHLAPDRVP